MTKHDILAKFYDINGRYNSPIVSMELSKMLDDLISSTRIKAYEEMRDKLSVVCAYDGSSYSEHFFNMISEMIDKEVENE